MTGQTITTSAELEALPVGSIVLTVRPHKDTPFDDDGRSRDTHPDYVLPATVLFRPDAPQPATGDAAGERAAVVDVLRRHTFAHWKDATRDNPGGIGYCGGCGQRLDGTLAQHQTDMLAEAGLLATDSLVEDILRDHPPSAEHDREVAAQALRDAAASFPASLPLGMTERDYLRGRAAGIAHGRIVAGEES